MIVESLIVLVLVIIPLWRIFDRTGRSGAWALLAIVPGIGGTIAALLWGYGPWPKYEQPGDGGGTAITPRPPPPPPAVPPGSPPAGPPAGSPGA